MAPGDKPLVWLHGEIKTPPFSLEARMEAGVLLRRLQAGERLGLPHSGPMPPIGPRCHELPIPDAQAAWRIVYRLDADAVVIAEVFSKKTANTPQQVIETCQRRLRASDQAVEEDCDMEKRNQRKLEAKGWRVGTAAEFLGLSSEEAALVEMKLRLSQALRARRQALHLSQVVVAKRLGSSQSRVAKMEAGDRSVSIDLLMKALVTLGATPADVGKALQHQAARVAA
jgi:phage-related protein/DNA-binding transcriptional regulator YiaG